MGRRHAALARALGRGARAAGTCVRSGACASRVYGWLLGGLAEPIQWTNRPHRALGHRRRCEGPDASALSRTRAWQVLLHQHEAVHSEGRAARSLLRRPGRPRGRAARARARWRPGAAGALHACWPHHGQRLRTGRHPMCARITEARRPLQRGHCGRASQPAPPPRTCSQAPRLGALAAVRHSLPAPPTPAVVFCSGLRPGEYAGFDVTVLQAVAGTMGWTSGMMNWCVEQTSCKPIVLCAQHQCAPGRKGAGEELRAGFALRPALWPRCCTAGSHW